MIHRSFRFRLYPTRSQAAAMQRQADAVRFVYNLALEQRRDFWRQAKARGVYLNFISQGREVTLLRREVDWLGAVAAGPLMQALRDLDKAFSGFFRGSGFPKFRCKERSNSFRLQDHHFTATAVDSKWAAIRIPKIGPVKLRLTRPWRGRIVNATFSRDALGWHVSIACEIEHEAPANHLPAVGIDRGVANTLALSTGEMLSTPATAHLDRRKKRAQRVLARRKRVSNRYRKQRQRLSRITAKIARVRREWQQRASTDIACRFGTVVLEDLRIGNMVRANRGLARSIMDQGWHAFHLKLAYKLEERGGALVTVNPAYTSQTCAACGVVDKRSRESQSRFACRHCGTAEHADVNAAKVILRRSSPVVEGSGCAPVEAKTSHALAA